MLNPTVPLRKTMRLHRPMISLLFVAYLALSLSSHAHAWSQELPEQNTPKPASTCSKPLIVSFFDINAEYDAQGLPLKPSHIDLLMVKGILALTGCEHTFKKMPWARMTYSLEHGKIDATFAASYSDERAKISRISVPYRQEEIGMVMRRSEISQLKIRNFQDIISSGKTVGIRLGIWYGKAFHDAFENDTHFRAHVLRAAGHGGLFDWLLLNRVDVLLSEVQAARNEIRRSGLEKELGLHPFLVHQGTTHIMLSRKTTTENDHAIINRAIEAFQQTDDYKRLNQIFGPE